jgi:thiol:disulfide interchange protein DsbG
LISFAGQVCLIGIISACISEAIFLSGTDAKNYCAYSRINEINPSMVAPSKSKILDAQAAAAKSTTLNASQVQSIVSQDTHGQLRAIGQYPAPFGLTAVEMVPNSGPAPERLIGYILPSDHALMIGMLYGGDGSNVTASIAASLPPPPQTFEPLATQNPSNLTDDSQLPMKTLMAPFNLGDYTHLNEGVGPTKLTVFFDPNCIFCNQLWHEIHAIPDYQRKFTISWIPLGMLRPTSPGESAAILKSSGVTGLDRDESHFDVSTETGGISPISDQKLVAEVGENNDKWASLMTKSDLPLATPAIVVNGKSIIVGRPNAYQISSIGKLPDGGNNTNPIP